MGAVSKAVDRLVAAGWCVRGAHPQDRRSSVLSLTPEGRERLAASRPVVEDALVSLTAGIAPGDLGRVAATLAALRANLEAGSRGSPG